MTKPQRAKARKMAQSPRLAEAMASIWPCSKSSEATRACGTAQIANPRGQGGTVVQHLAASGGLPRRPAGTARDHQQHRPPGGCRLRRPGDDDHAQEGDRHAAEPQKRGTLAQQEPAEEHGEGRLDLQHEHGGRGRQPLEAGKDQIGLDRRDEGGQQEEAPEGRGDAADIAHQAEGGDPIGHRHHQHRREMLHHRLAKGEAHGPEDLHGNGDRDVDGFHAWISCAGDGI